MSPEKAASIRSRMHICIELLSRLCFVVGAKISMSRWRRSHQNGADVVLLDGCESYEDAMARIIADWSVMKEALFLPFRK